MLTSYATGPNVTDHEKRTTYAEYATFAVPAGWVNAHPILDIHCDGSTSSIARSHSDSRR